MYLEKSSIIRVTEPDKNFQWVSSFKDKFPELHCETYEGGRYYHTPKGNSYPSITTLLGTLPKDGLEKWRKAIGEEEADKILKAAGKRGTGLHNLCEDYISNEQNYLSDKKPRHQFLFNNIKKHINKIDQVIGLELPLYSNKLGIAGRTDCVANFDNVASIIDFKTSRNEKREEWIRSYFLQGTFYSLAFQEMTGLKVPQIVLIFALDGGDTQLFIRDRKDYIKELVQLVKTNKVLIPSEEELRCCSL